MKLVSELFTKRRIQAKLFKEHSGAPQRSGRAPQYITHHTVECGDRVHKDQGVRSLALTLPLCKESRDTRPCLRRSPWNASHLWAPATLHHMRYLPSSHDSREQDFGSTGLKHHQSAFGLITSPSSFLGFRNVNQPGATPRAGDTSTRVHFLQQAHQLGPMTSGADLNASFGNPSGPVARRLGMDRLHIGDHIQTWWLARCADQRPNLRQLWGGPLLRLTLPAGMRSVSTTIALPASRHGQLTHARESLS